MSDWAAIIAPSSPLGIRAWEAVNAISDALASGTYPPMFFRKRVHRPFEEPLLYGYLGIADEREHWLERATDVLNTSIHHASELKGYVGLYGGLCGLGWVVEHLSRTLDADTGDGDGESSGAADPERPGAPDANEEIDAFVIDKLGGGDWTGQYDLISGLAGVGVYFLERLPAASAVQGLELVIAELERTSEITSAGITWHTPPSLLPEQQRERCPTGHYNLGVAHGVPGVIHFLGEAWTTEIDRERVDRLLDRSMAWLIEQQRPAGSLSRFSSWVVPNESTDSRLGWCYGDLGILAVTLQVARRTRRSDWLNFSRELLDHCLAWPVERSGIADAPLCHGAIGVAHVFNRIYQSEGDERCRDAALLWYGRSLAMRRDSGGVAGFTALTRPDPAGPEVWEPSPSFLDGALGIALALLAGLTPVEPQWDRLLLLSGRRATSLLPAS